MSARLAILGAGGHALVVADIVRLLGRFELVGFLDDSQPGRAGQNHAGGTILGGNAELDALRASGVELAFVAIGDCQARLRTAELLRAKGFQSPTLVHPRATVAADTIIGAGSLIAAGAIIAPAARVGEFAIVNTGATVDHEAIIADGVHVGPGVHLGGRVEVGRGTWLGIGAVARDGAKIGARAVVGAGAVVIKDLPDDVLAYGVPARPARRFGERGNTFV